VLSIGKLKLFGGIQKSVKINLRSASVKILFTKKDISSLQINFEDDSIVFSIVCSSFIVSIVSDKFESEI